MDKQFNDLWQDELEPWLAGLEAERRQTVRNMWVWTFSALGAGLLVFLILGLVDDELFAWIPVAGVGAVLALIIGHARVDKLRKRIKEELNTRIAGAFGLEYQVKPYQTPRFRRFGELGLAPHHDRRSFEDYFSGTVRGCGFELYEANLEERRTRTVTTNGRTRTETYYVTVFHGVLIRIDFPRKVEGITVITRDAGWFNALGGFGRRINGRKLERIGLVDPTFEKTFEVYGDDQVLARYMLTPAFMERLLELEASLKGKSATAAFDAHSGQGELMIAAQTGNLFEAGSMYKPLADQGRVKSIIDEIRLILDIIDMLVEPPAESDDVKAMLARNPADGAPASD